MPKSSVKKNQDREIHDDASDYDSDNNNNNNNRDDGRVDRDDTSDTGSDVDADGDLASEYAASDVDGDAFGLERYFQAEGVNITSAILEGVAAAEDIAGVLERLVEEIRKVRKELLKQSQSQSQSKKSE